MCVCCHFERCCEQFPFSHAHVRRAACARSLSLAPCHLFEKNVFFVHVSLFFYGVPWPACLALLCVSTYTIPLSPVCTSIVFIDFHRAGPVIVVWCVRGRSLKGLGLLSMSHHPAHTAAGYYAFENTAHKTSAAARQPTHLLLDHYSFRRPCTLCNT